MKGRFGGRTGNGLRKPTPSRRLIAIVGWTLIAAAPSSAQTQELETTMNIYRNGASPANRPPESTFTGDVYISDYFQRAAPSRLSGATALFSPGARTPWKVNPVGQTVVVTSGVGWAQVEGEEIVEIHAGDVIWFPPGQRHWEGGTPDQEMTYFAIQEGGVRFGERVTDEEYQKGPQAK